MSNHNLNERFLNGVQTRNFDCVHECLSLGVSLATTDWAGYTALHFVAKDGTLIEIGQLLLRYGANVNISSKLRKTPLHLACQYANSKTIQLFLNNGADLYAKDILQMTPFHWITVSTTTQDILNLFGQYLKPHDIKLFDIKDKFQRTCFDIIKIKKNFELIRCFESLKSQLRLGQFNKDSQLGKIKNQLKSQVSFKSNIQPSTSQEFNLKSIQKIRKPFEAHLDDLDSDDDSDTNFRCGLDISSKKTKISSSPIQNIEDTLLWLQNQALANSSDDFILEDKEFYLTEAGVLALDYLNKIDPIGDEQRLLLKWAKDLEPPDKELENKNENDDDLPLPMNEDWLFDPDLNFNFI